MLITALKLKLFSVGAIVSNHIVNTSDNASFLQQLHVSLNDARLIFIEKNHQKVIFSWWMLFIRCVFYLDSCKNIGNPYCEPTIVVHDITAMKQYCTRT